MSPSPRIRLRTHKLHEHQAALRACRRCPDMQPPVVVGNPVLSPVMLVGQAPGAKEPLLGRPFAWTAGKQLFAWFEPLGLSEADFRARVYMAAVCRCFPGKLLRGGDRVPAPTEVENCRPWLQAEIALVEPELIVPVGRLAIAQFLPARPLQEQIGAVERIRIGKHACDLIPLPHPSGASVWPRIEPGRSLTARALRQIAEHPAWQRLLG